MAKSARYLNILFLVAIGALIVMNIFTRTHVSELYDVTRQRANARQRVVVSERLIASLREAEAHQRGYLLTRSPELLKDYQSATAMAEKRCQELMDLLEGLPEQQSRVEYIRTVTRQKAAAMQRLIDQVNSNPKIPKFPLELATDKEWEVLPKIISDMSGAELKRIQEKEAQSRSLVKKDYRAVDLVAFLSALLAVFAFVVAERERRRKEADLTNESAAHRKLQIEQRRAAEIIGMQHALASLDREQSNITEVILSHAARLTDADGSVIELIEGDNLVYEASWGKRAPDRGLRLPLANSLSGLALKEKKSLICVDSETDDRVFLEGCRKAGIRSMIVMPLINGGHVLGILKVYSLVPQKFTEDDQAALVLVSGTLSSTLMQIQHLKSLRDVESQLVRAKELAETSTRAKSQFLANMSHEIRTPLNGILGIAEHLETTPLSPQQLDCVKTIETSGEALLAIINDILDFSKIEAGMLVLASINFNLLESFREVQKIFTHASQNRKIDLVFEIDPELHTNVKGDPGRLMQILLNLVGNAIKFTPQGRVTVAARTSVAENGQVIAYFEISDTGIGIAQDAFDRLFQAFQQADSSTSRNHGGTGLGLSICKHLIHQMNGQIGVRSRLGSGSTFWFNVKLEQGQPMATMYPQQQDAASQPNMKFPKASVMLVEDNVVNQKVVQHAFADYGVNVVVVESGRQALETLKTQRFDLILMDCQMPEMDGYETTHKIRSLPDSNVAHVPIIALTANAMFGDREKCLSAGMDDYLAKPFKAAELRKIVQNWLMKGPGFENPSEVFRAYLQIMPAYLDKVEHGYKIKDWNMVATAAHSIKSSSANIGAYKLGRMAEVIEGMAMKQPDGFRSQTITSFRTEFIAVSKLLNSHLLDLTSLETIYPLRGISCATEPSENR